MNLPMKQKQTHRHRGMVAKAGGGKGRIGSLVLVDANYYI